MTWKTAALALVPGLIQIRLGRAGRGLAWFALFALLLNAFLIAPFLTASTVLRWGAFAGAAAAWTASVWDGARCARAKQP